MLWYLGGYDPGGTAPSRANQFLDTVNFSPSSVHFKCKPTDPEPAPQPPISDFQGLSCYSPALVTSGPGST